MTQRWQIWLGVGLLAAVIVAAFYFPALRHQVDRAAQLTEKTAEQARRELVPPAPNTSGEPLVKVKMFWGSKSHDGTLTPVTVELPLASDPVLRSKQVLNTLLAGPVDPEARTLPPDAALLAFYMLPDGTAVADFSEAMATSIPSGIQSEQTAVDSIARTLEADVPQVMRLRILIHGQEVDTLAGHLDLTQPFQVNTKLVIQPPVPSKTVATAPPANPSQNPPPVKSAPIIRKEPTASSATGAQQKPVSSQTAPVVRKEPNAAPIVQRPPQDTSKPKP